MANATRHGMTHRKFLQGVGTTTTGWPVVTTLWRDGQAATASLGEGVSRPPCRPRGQLGKRPGTGGSEHRADSAPSEFRDETGLPEE
jgi:hypothetical protein